MLDQMEKHVLLSLSSFDVMVVPGGCCLLVFYGASSCFFLVVVKNLVFRACKDGDRLLVYNPIVGKYLRLRTTFLSYII